MRIGYVLLSPTFGMHQYTADLANRMVRAGHDVHLITTRHCPFDRYLSAIQIHTPVDIRDTGFSPRALWPAPMRGVQRVVRELGPDLVHVTGPHLWNPILLRFLRRAGFPAVHSLHDLDPHSGTSYGPLLYLWNRTVIGWADHILVHGACYRERLLDRGVPPSKVTHTPLLHLFVGSAWWDRTDEVASQVQYEPWALFFGRLERYKGVDHLVDAVARLGDLPGDNPRLVLAGQGAVGRLDMPAARIEVRNCLVDDNEAIDLFRRCGLLVLPYVDATQSALIGAAYYFHKPVLVTRTGALPEYVQEGRTGWVVAPGDTAALAERLAEALIDPARLARLGRAGRVWYNEQRGLEEQALLAMYEGMTGGCWATKDL